MSKLSQTYALTVLRFSCFGSKGQFELLKVKLQQSNVTQETNSFSFHSYPLCNFERNFLHPQTSGSAVRKFNQPGPEWNVVLVTSIVLRKKIHNFACDFINGEFLYFWSALR